MPSYCPEGHPLAVTFVGPSNTVEFQSPNSEVKLWLGPSYTIESKAETLELKVRLDPSDTFEGKAATPEVKLRLGPSDTVKSTSSNLGSDIRKGSNNTLKIEQQMSCTRSCIEALALRKQERDRARSVYPKEHNEEAAHVLRPCIERLGIVTESEYWAIESTKSAACLSPSPGYPEGIRTQGFDKGIESKCTRELHSCLFCQARREPKRAYIRQQGRRQSLG